MKMVNIEGELLRKLQMTELEMIIEVDRICRKHQMTLILSCCGMSKKNSITYV